MNEMNDWQLSQWISQWLAGELDDSQQAKLQAALLQSPASQAFAQWSRLIQESAAETQRLESQLPEDVPFDPAECLSDLSKARLQRAVLNALKQGTEQSGFQHQLRVAQSPNAYNSRPAGSEADGEAVEGVEGAAQPADANQSFDELLRGGRELGGRLIAQFSGLLQTLHWVTSLVSLSNLQNSATGEHALPASSSATASGHSSISLEQLASVITTMLRVQNSLCAISLARYQTHRFDELLRVQRGPRDLSDLRLLPVDRLRHGAATAFHQTVFGAPPRTPMFDLDHSVAGWHRIALGLPLTAFQLPVDQYPVEAPQDPSTAARLATASTLDGHRWGLAIVEADIDRLVNAQIADAGVDAMVTLIDRHDRIIFSTPPRPDAPVKPVAELIGGQILPAQDMARTGEMHLPDKGIWASLLNCSAPLDNLRLVLSRTG